MYSLKYKVTTSTCDSEGRLNNANYVRMAMELLPDDFKVSGLRVEYRVAAKLGDSLVPTLYRVDGGIVVALAVGDDVSAIVEFTYKHSTDGHGGQATIA